MSTIVGFTFQAEQFCLDCIYTFAFDSAMNVKADDLSDALDARAKEMGINRSDETSFDSSVFPKIIRGEWCQAEDTEERPADRCDGCSAPLVDTYNPCGWGA